MKYQKILSTPTCLVNESHVDRASSKGCYRFFSNVKVTPERIMISHQEKIVERCKALGKDIYVIQDTTTITPSQRYGISKDLGHITRKDSSNKDSGCHSYLLHNSLCISSDDMPLGLLSQKIYTHNNKSTSLRDSRKQRPIEEKESYRWLESLYCCNKLLSDVDSRVIMISDRESDIYEYLQEANRLEQKVILRSFTNRNTTIKGIKLSDFLSNLISCGSYSFIDHNYNNHNIDVFYGKVTFKSPNRSKKSTSFALSNISYNVIYAKESNVNEDGIEWILLTNIDINDYKQALEIIKAYSKRWHIENFHKVLKTAFRIEDIRLESYEKIQKLATLLSIIAYRLYYLVHIGRIAPNKSCTTLLSKYEWQSLCLQVKNSIPKTAPSISQAITYIAIMGGYFNRKSDPKPGLIPIWRGWRKLNNIASFFEKTYQQKDVGNR